MLAAGAGGALALNAAHEIGRRARPDAPRMDVIAMRALSGLLARLKLHVRSPRQLRRWALAGDLLANGMFYAALLGRRPRHPWLRGITGGAVAGLAGALLPPRLGLGRSPGTRRPSTALLTLAWYLTGGLVAAALTRTLSRREG